MTSFTIVPAGAYSLRESAESGFGQRHAVPFDGTMRLAFCSDDLAAHAGVALTQDASGVHGVVSGDAPVELAEAQTARMLSLDVDAHGYEAVAGRDPVVARVLATAPGLRPPPFHSPYEAARLVRAVAAVERAAGGRGPRAVLARPRPGGGGGR